MSQFTSRIAFCFLLVLGLAIAQTPAGPVISIENVMSAADFRRTGLQKLNSEELAALNAWLSDYTLRVYNAATGTNATASPTPGSTSSAIETQLDGDFQGWDGDTIFKLANGQIWQQDSYAYTYHYAYRPKVIIYKSGAAYRMKVDGVDSTIAVKRLR